jgi:hypothetical protein
MKALPLAVVLIVLLASLPVRAEFRGDERFERNFTYNSEYFFQVESFSLPSWWDRVWMWGDTGYRMTLGSVKTDEFFLYQEGRLAYPLLPWLEVGYTYLDTEDFDGRFQRHRTRLKAQTDSWAVGGFVELCAFKEWIDMGVSAEARVPGLCETKLAFTFVDSSFNRKAGRAGTYPRKPYSLAWEGRIVLRPGFRAEIFLEADFPLRLEDRINEFVFGFHRYRLRALAVWDFAPYWTARASVAGEICGKRWEYTLFTPVGDPPDPLEERFTRKAFEARVEVTRRLGVTTGHLINAGGKWIQLREQSLFPNDPLADVRLTKRDFIFWLRARIDLGEGFFAMPALYVGPVWHRKHYVNTPELDNERQVPLNSKINLSLGFRFSDNAVLLGSISFALDRTEFDGGQASFVLSF